jgi:hypothetical protein
VTETAAAIRATFVNVRPVASRGQVQLVFEVPSEQADHALNVLGGFPKPANPVWVGVARLGNEVDATARLAAGTDMDVPKEAQSVPVAEKKPATLVTQAYMICQDPKWNDYLERKGMKLRNADAMRVLCGVESRSEIIEGTHAGDLFKIVQRDFNQFKRDGTIAERAP